MTSSSSGPVLGESGDETVAGTLAPPTERAAPVAPGDKIGRYVVLREVGRGAMGSVFAAYDPELDRRIALKVIGRDGQRITAEARAMARLSHPNVVGIHDISEVRGHALIAMELVDGTTLAAWLATKPPVPQVIDAFVAAGRGLAAAHEAGIVHRDFKPANVLVEVDEDSGELGRVRVGDFGLAQAKTTQSLTGGAQSNSRDDGRLAGTPRYMAPEQFGDDPVSARSDQFSFCVALYEGLYGEPPFPGKTPVEIARAVLEGDRCPVPERGDVPRRVRLACERGLSIEPGRRFESMKALLAELVPPMRRRSWVLTAALVGLAGAGGLAIAPDPVPPGCEPDAAAAISPQRRERARIALEKHGLTAETWSQIEGLIEDWEGKTTAARREICAAHEADRVSQDALFSTLHCIDVEDAEVDALVTLWEQADQGTAAVAKQALFSVLRDSCREVKARRVAPQDMEPELLERLVESRASALALQTSGRHREAIEVVGDAQLDSLPRCEMVADLYRVRALARADLGNLDGAEADLWTSAAMATEVEAHEKAALAWIWLIRIVGVDRDQPEIALQWQGVAEAHAGEDAWLLALLHNHLGNVHYGLGNADGAEDAFRASLEASQRVSIPIPGHDALLLNNLGSIAAAHGRYDEAAELWHKSVELHREGSENAKLGLGSPLGNLARLYTRTGHDEAAQARRDYLDYAQALSHASPAAASYAAATTAELLVYAGQFSDARAAAQDALAYLRSVENADAGLLAGLELRLGQISRSFDRESARNADFDSGMEAVDAGARVAKPVVVGALLTEAELAMEHGDSERAESLVTRAASLADGERTKRPLPRDKLQRLQARLLGAKEGPQAALDHLAGGESKKVEATIFAARAQWWLRLGDRAQAESEARSGVAALGRREQPTATDSCYVYTALVRATAPDVDPTELAAAVEACDTDPPRPEAEYLATLRVTDEQAIGKAR